MVKKSLTGENPCRHKNMQIPGRGQMVYSSHAIIYLNNFFVGLFQHCYWNLLRFWCSRYSGFLPQADGLLYISLGFYTGYSFGYTTYGKKDSGITCVIKISKWFWTVHLNRSWHTSFQTDSHTVIWKGSWHHEYALLTLEIRLSNIHKCTCTDKKWCKESKTFFF